MDEVDLLIYTKDPDLEEKKENRKRRELYWGLHRDELWHRHSYNVKFQVSSCDFDRLLQEWLEYERIEKMEQEELKREA